MKYDLNYFAFNQYRAYKVYSYLATFETDIAFKRILLDLAKHELDHYKFWLRFSSKKEFFISSIYLFWFKFVRKVLGLTFTARYLERNEEELIAHYKTFLEKTTDLSIRKEIRRVIKHEEENERELIGQIKEEKVAFISSIILGLNDGLIELTGALVGFAFALRENLVVALTGSITGLAASLSMASSAYMQAKYEPGKDARKAAIYTGITYIIVVLLLLMPFIFSSTIFIALGFLLGIIFLIITSVSYYTAILFNRSFRKQFGQMALFSLGVALITFLIGLVLRYFVGVEA
jgi:VIT1/CCC1 family predicted Fe2+/Mn2+ transporter